MNIAGSPSWKLIFRTKFGFSFENIFLFRFILIPLKERLPTFVRSLFYFYEYRSLVISFLRLYHFN